MNIGALSNLRIFSKFEILTLVSLLILVTGIVGYGQQPVAADKRPAEPKAPAKTSTGPADTKASETGKIKVVFDDKLPGVVYIESNGERIRVDTGKRSVDQVAVVTDSDAGGVAVRD